MTAQPQVRSTVILGQVKNRSHDRTEILLPTSSIRPGGVL